jgi:hypothetical protein
MARKISDLTNPRRAEHLKKSAAEYLIRNLMADWIEEGVSLVRRTAKEIANFKSIRIEGPIKQYIPERLPPVEVPQVRFREPETERWMQQHRSVNRFWAT